MAERGAPNARLHPDLRRAPLTALPFHWRWALPLWRFGTRLARSPVGPDVEVRNHIEAGVRVLLYRPRERASGAALLWLHGGGFTLGTPRADDARCGAFSRAFGLTAVSVDYRLAPEHPFPAALDDAHAAWTWLQAATEGLGVDRGRVVIGGGSAGGGLAACLAQRLRDEGGMQPAAQLLLFPMLDDRTAARRDLAGVRHLVWHNRSNRAGWSAYLGRARARRSCPSMPPRRAGSTCVTCRLPGSAWATSTCSWVRAERTRNGWRGQGSRWRCTRSRVRPTGSTSWRPRRRSRWRSWRVRPRSYVRR